MLDIHIYEENHYHYSTKCMQMNKKNQLNPNVGYSYL